MRAFVLALVLFAGAPASALDPWTESDTRREALIGAVAVTDIALTHYLLTQRGISEQNPVLGRDPSPEKLWGLGLSAIAVHVLVARLLPRDLRDGWQAAGIAVELVVTTANASLAVQVAL